MLDAPSLRDRLNRMSRADVEHWLAQASIQCYDSESTEDLREALAECIENGDIHDPTD